MSFENRPKFVCILTQYFYPDLPGTAKIAKDLALGYAKNGFIVNVYTGSPAYSVVNDSNYQIFNDNVRVHRVYSPRLSRSGNLIRLINGFLVALIISFILFFKKNDIIVVDSTSPFLLVITFVIRVIKKTPYIVVVHDVYPDIAIKLGVISKSSPLALIWKNVYRWVYQWSSRIVVLGSNMEQIISKDLKKSTKTKIEIIPNWADGNVIKPSSSKKCELKKRMGFEDCFVVIYSGNMGLTHDIDTILKSAEKLMANPKITYLLIGGGGQFNSAVKFISDKGLNNVKILPYQPEDLFPKYLACADVALVTLASGMEGLSVPSKIYSSLAAGLPIIGIVNEPSEIATIIAESQCGYRSSPKNVDALVGVIKQLYADSDNVGQMGVNARREFEKKYSKEIGVRKHITLVNVVLSENN